MCIRDRHHPALVEGAIDAVRRYGTQFSSSRAYVSPTLYTEVEDLLEQVFGIRPVVTPTTTLGHIAALPVLVTRNDAALVDRQVHNSVQTAAALAGAQGARIEVVSHNDVDAIRTRALELAGQHERVWYLADGLYSMFGDFAPMRALMALLDEIPNLHLYVDDAHATGWFGEHGRGYALECSKGHPRVIVAASFAKSFACTGGALLIPDPELRRVVRNCGGPMTFSGPLTPPTLGSLAASARVHLSDEFKTLQAHLFERMELADRRARDLGLTMMNAPMSPVRFLAVGDEAATRPLVAELRAKGYWTNAACFPAVPKGRSGVRFTLSNTMTLDDVEGLLTTIATLLPAHLARVGASMTETREAFARIATRLNHGIAA